MAIQITIRHVPEDVRNALARRAAGRHQSMQEYLLETLTEIAQRPEAEEWLRAVAARKRGAAVSLTESELLELRDAERR